jgi:hypothetical protein
LYPDIFINRLLHELKWLQRNADKRNYKLYIRLNVFSDILCEKEFPIIFQQFPDIQFYDYTKHHKRMLRYLDARRGLNDATFPANYQLTFSRSENNWEQCEQVLMAGGNVAVPFHVGRTKPLPQYWNGFRVYNGDLTDLRPLDPQNGYIIGLRAKGKGRADHESGFIVNPISIGNLPRKGD